MIQISSLLGCRNCLQSDGIRHVYILQDGEPQKYREKAEFEVMTLLEKWRTEDNKACPFCGSLNIEVHDVEIDGYPLYEYKRLVERCKPYVDFLFMLNIDKQGAHISMKIGGSKDLPSDFLKHALQKIIRTISNRPDNNFMPQPKGNFFICVSSQFDFSSGNNFLRLERFRNSGLTRNEIIDEIKPLAQQFEIKIEVNDSKNPSNDKANFKKSVKSSVFTSWFHKIAKKF